jgi:protein O-mannosyl-transferase
MSFFILALFTKEAALMLLMVCPLYLLLVARIKLRLSRYLIPVVVWIMATLAWALLRTQAVSQLKHVTPSAMLLSAWRNSPGMLQYLGKVIFPFNLSVVPLMRDTTFLWGGLAASGLAAGILFSRGKRISHVVFGLLFFVVFLLPSIMLVVPGQSVSLALLEHRLYLPIVGIILVMLETDLAKKWTEDRKLAKMSLLLVLLPFAFLAIFHSRHFKDESSFWGNALANSPHAAFVHASVAQSLNQQGRRNEAIKEYRTALDLNPSEFMALVNLANLDYSREEYDEAEKLLMRALSEEPADPDVRHNLLAILERIRENKKFKSMKSSGEQR